MRIEVAGIPAPQGSKRHVGGGRMVEVSRAVGPWREAVRAETQGAVRYWNAGRNNIPFPAGQPVYVRIEFSLPRPKSAPKSVIWPAKRPDLDKLVRSVLDGIVDGGAIQDDSQVIQIMAIKMFGSPPGCSISIEEA